MHGVNAMVSQAEVAAILGDDFPNAPPLSFMSVWENMKIERVWRKLRDLLPDDDLFLVSASLFDSVVV
jgi:hypothetical protein